MRKVALVGDLHLDPRCENGRIREAVVKGQDDLLKTMVSDLRDRDIHTIVFAGDIFTNRQTVSVSTLNYVIWLFGTLLADFDVYVIAGNHDLMYDDSNEMSSIQLLKLFDNVHTYISGTARVDIDGYSWYFVPWVSSGNMQAVSEWLGKLALKGNAGKNVIVGHFDIYGALMEAGQTSTCGFDVNRFYGAAAYTFSGHYHCRSVMDGGSGKVYYLGSPYHLSFAHVGTDCGYYIFDGETVEFVKNTVSAEFVDLMDTDIDLSKDGSVVEVPGIKGKMVRYFQNTARSSEECLMLRMSIDAGGPCHVKLVPYGSESDIEESRTIDDESSRKILSSDSMTMAEMYMDKYPDKLPALLSGESARERIVTMLREYTEKK